MGVQYSNWRTDTNGLLTAFDASDISSYPGSGNNAFDLINNNQLPFFNGLGYSNNGGLKSFTFDGVDDYMELPYQDFVGISHITVEAWVKINSGNATLFLNYDPAQSTNHNMWFATSNTTARIGFANGGWNTYFSLTTANVTDSKPIKHLVLTYHRWEKTSKIYFNGVLKKSLYHGYYYNQIKSPVQNIFVGKHPAVSGYEFNGELYSMKVYNKRFTEEEVLNSYNLQKSRFGH